MILVNNDNTLIISRLRNSINPSVVIYDAGFSVTLCEYNIFKPLAVSSSSNTQITLDTENHNFEIGDEVLVNRVIGPEDVNGLFEVTNIVDNIVTLNANTTGNPPYVEGTGAIFRVVISGLSMTYNEDTEEYYGILDGELDLIPDKKYLVFLQETDLNIEIEYIDTARIRRR